MRRRKVFFFFPFQATYFLAGGTSVRSPTEDAAYGFDPSSGAGVTADLMVFAAFGSFGTAAVTALTVQSTLGVRASHPVSDHPLRETLHTLHEDLPPAGIKIGMLATAANVEVVADFLSLCKQQAKALPIVLDPVLHSSSGRELLDAAGIACLKECLLPLVDWITPNLAELGDLAGTSAGTPSEMEAAVLALRARHPRLGIVATGGHLEVADDLVATPGQPIEWLRSSKIVSQATHGTGCAFASALLCGLVEGKDGLAAARGAKHFVTEAILRAEPIGHGRGPMNLLWPLQNRTHVT